MNPVVAMGHKRLDFLDQIRALAILSVVFLHYRPDVFPGGAIGVGMFFCLSGFLIATMLLEEPVLDGAAAGRFIFRRIMRIYPAYVAAILASTILTFHYAPANLPNVIRAIPGLLTFTRMPPFPSMYFGVLWSLQVEAWFYIFMPMFMLVLGRRRGLIVFSGVLLLAGATMPFVPHASSWPTLLQWGSVLAVGSLTSLAWKEGLLPRTPALTVVPCLLVIAVLIGTADGQLLLYKDLIAALCVATMIAAFITAPTIFVVPGSPFIGRTSYSMYLWHAVILSFGLYLPPGMGATFSGVRFALYIFVTICVGTISYFYIEKPGIRLGKKLTTCWMAATVAEAQ